MKNKIIEAVIARIRSLFLNTGINKETKPSNSIIIARSLGISGPIKHTYNTDVMMPIGREIQK
ncbi:MAG: hypothetical protein WCQ47_06595 [bacterium]